MCMALNSVYEDLIYILSLYVRMYVCMVLNSVYEDLSVYISYAFRTLCLKGDNPAVKDVECLNCWNAIYAVGAGRHYIARVQGQPINTVSSLYILYVFILYIQS